MAEATVSVVTVNEICVNATVAAVLSEFHIKRTKNGTKGFPQWKYENVFALLPTVVHRSSLRGNDPNLVVVP